MGDIQVVQRSPHERIRKAADVLKSQLGGSDVFALLTPAVGIEAALELIVEEAVERTQQRMIDELKMKTRL